MTWNTLRCCTNNYSQSLPYRSLFTSHYGSAGALEAWKRCPILRLKAATMYLCSRLKAAKLPFLWARGRRWNIYILFIYLFFALVVIQEREKDPCQGLAFLCSITENGRSYYIARNLARARQDTGDISSTPSSPLAGGTTLPADL